MCIYIYIYIWGGIRQDEGIEQNPYPSFTSLKHSHQRYENCYIVILAPKP